MTAFDEERDANIERNRQILADMGLIGAVQSIIHSKPKVQKPRPKKAGRPLKRKEPPPSDATSEDGDEPAPKALRVEVESTPAESGGVRRSARNAAKRVDYSGDGDNLATERAVPRMLSRAAIEATSEPRSSMQRIHDPYVITSHSRNYSLKTL